MKGNVKNHAASLFYILEVMGIDIAQLRTEKYLFFFLDNILYDDNINGRNIEYYVILTNSLQNKRQACFCHGKVSMEGWLKLDHEVDF